MKISYIVPISFLAMLERVRVIYTNARVYDAAEPTLESLTLDHHCGHSHGLVTVRTPLGVACRPGRGGLSEGFLPPGL